MLRKLLTIACSFSFSHAYAQIQDTSIFKYPIQMDTVVVTAARGGWDIKGFIRRVQTDTTFYKAFRSIHLVSYTTTNDIQVFDKNNKVQASLYSHTRQTVKDGCRTMEVTDEKSTGDFYDRKRHYNYYTAELYAYLFFTNGKVCGEDNIVAGHLNEQGKGKMEKSKAQLKLLIFNPGAHISGVPFMGDKADIFDDHVARHYDFKLLSETYAGVECYVFKLIVKKGEEGSVVYNELSTWFRKSDYAIVARNYSLSYSTLVYDFNVNMQVRTTEKNGLLLPASIKYDGNWHVFTKKREKVKFISTFSY